MGKTKHDEVEKLDAKRLREMVKQEKEAERNSRNGKNIEEKYKEKKACLELSDTKKVMKEGKR